MKFINKIYNWAEVNKLKTLFFLGVVIDFWACWYSYALVHDWIVTQAFLGFVLPFLNFLGAMWWIDEKDIIERLKMTTVTAFAMVLGSTFMLLMVKSGYGVGKDFIP